MLMVMQWSLIANPVIIIIIIIIMMIVMVQAVAGSPITSPTTTTITSPVSVIIIITGYGVWPSAFYQNGKRDLWFEGLDCWHSLMIMSMRCFWGCL